MRLSLFGLSCILSMWMVTISCERVRPEAPSPTTLDSTLYTPLSDLAIPIQYEVSKLEEMINTKIQGTFVNEKLKVNEKGDSLYLKIEKRGVILLSWNSPSLYCSFPVKVSGTYVKRIGNRTIRNNQPVEMEVVIHMSTRLSLRKDWQLKTESSLEEIKWIRDPKLNIIGVKINLRKQVENAINKSEDKLIAKLDETLPALLDTRKTVEKLWLDIQKPIRINKKGVQVWLKAYGEHITARLINDGPDHISLRVQLKAFLRTVIEGETMPDSNLILPAYSPAKSSIDSLSMFVNVSIPFVLASRLLNEQLTGKELSAEGYTTSIRSIDLYGTDSALALKVSVKGDVDGRIFLTAIPGYDTITSTLFAKKFAFDIDTENTLVSSANWLLHDDALDLIKSKLTIDVTPFIDSIPLLITRGIEKGRVGEKIDLRISSLDIKPVNYLISKNEFQVLFHAIGNASIDLEQKVFNRKKKTKRKIKR
jgi:hypothetical protein